MDNFDRAKHREYMRRYYAKHRDEWNAYQRKWRFNKKAKKGEQHKIDKAPTVDAVEVSDIIEFAEDVVYQFGYYGQYEGRLHIGHGGLSTLEWAFDILGWENPHPVPEFECEIDGCHEHATCGAPTKDGYKRMCGKHYRERRSDG